MQKYNFKSSNAFIKKLHIKPYQSGQLEGLSFAVKDLIDIAGEITGAGNPTWASTHPKAATNAVCVDQLLLEGATCLGKTITDELAYSLLGENYFYGTPVNPKAPDRVPGGSSSGSASAVACGLVDFALGTDTGGSIRVPASNCGIWGYRPSHGRISVAGVFPFAPTFDTVGILAKNEEVLKKVIAVLLGTQPIESENDTIPGIYMLEDFFAICDAEIQEVLLSIIQKLGKKFSIKKTNLNEITKKNIDHVWLRDTYVLLQTTEIWSCLGSWIEAYQPKFGAHTEYNFYHIAKGADRLRIQECIQKREMFAKQMNSFLNTGKLLCFPTTPALAPLRGTITPEARSSGTYYSRAFNTISGLSRSPQITIPVAEINGVPIGLSILAGYSQDQLLSEVSCKMAKYLS